MVQLSPVIIHQAQFEFLFAAAATAFVVVVVAAAAVRTFHKFGVTATIEKLQNFQHNIKQQYQQQCNERPPLQGQYQRMSNARQGKPEESIDVTSVNHLARTQSNDAV